MFLDWSRGGYFAFCSPLKILLPRVGFVKLQTKKLYRRDRQELQELKIAKKSKRGREEVPERCYAELLTLAAANRLSQASRLFSRNADPCFLFYVVTNRPPGPSSREKEIPHVQNV